MREIADIGANQFKRLSAKQKNMIIVALQMRKESCDENNETRESKEWQKIIDTLRG